MCHRDVSFGFKHQPLKQHHIYTAIINIHPSRDKSSKPTTYQYIISAYNPAFFLRLDVSRTLCSESSSRSFARSLTNAHIPICCLYALLVLALNPALHADASRKG